MNKLNFGCGDRLAPGWVNIDFHSHHPGVRRVNLLRRLPFADNSFDVVYSSHVLEHFSRDTAASLLRECHRILKPGGILRVVVPDLENVCREYLRILELVNSSTQAREQYDWIILELLDQLTRTEPSGLMRRFKSELAASNRQEMLNYVTARTENKPSSQPTSYSFADRFRRLSVQKVVTKIIYFYVGVVRHLFPPSLRATIVDNTMIGEKHKWMYDRHGMSLLLAACGFSDIQFLTASESRIPNLLEDRLDVNQDGRPYKNVSLYSEARKP